MGSIITSAGNGARRLRQGRTDSSLAVISLSTCTPAMDPNTWQIPTVPEPATENFWTRKGCQDEERLGLWPKKRCANVLRFQCTRRPMLEGMQLNRGRGFQIA